MKLFAASLFGVIVLTGGCAGDNSAVDAGVSAQRSPTVNPAEYSEQVRQNYAQSCEAAIRAPSTSSTPYGNGKLSRLFGSATPASASMSPACQCPWDWITTHVPFRDFVKWDVAVRSGTSTEVPEWVVDAQVACS
ncbi:hypothetical protein [Nocardioides phosphati]|uniref:hypothetical protein n=1 Tax=Nocardioides phosphati TaxID=1867775 RepID=UPI00166A9F4E|nr:hypothetical protein [Nocardioides phosphati]